MQTHVNLIIFDSEAIIMCMNGFIPNACCHSYLLVIPMWSDNGSLSLPPPPSLTPSTPTHHLAVMWLYATPYIPILVPSLAWVWGYPIPPRPPSNFINVRIRYLYIIISVEVIGCVVISSSWAQNCHNIISQDLAIVLGHLIIETHKHNQSLTILLKNWHTWH